VLTTEKANGVAFMSTAKEARHGSYEEFVKDFMSWWEGELIRKGESTKDLGLKNPDQGFKAKLPS
jgi:hypothetical protein